MIRIKILSREVKQALKVAAVLGNEIKAVLNAVGLSSDRAVSSCPSYGLHDDVDADLCRSR